MALTISELAREASSCFGRREVHRVGASDPETITTTKDGDTPDWMRLCSIAQHRSRSQRRVV